MGGEDWSGALGGDGWGGAPKAKASEDEEAFIAGGGGVGYEMDGTVCWKTE